MLTHTHTHATPPYCSTRYSRSDVTERNKKYNKSSKFMDLQFRRVWSTKGKRAEARATVRPERTAGGPLIFFLLHCFFLLQIFTAPTRPPPASSTACGWRVPMPPPRPAHLLPPPHSPALPKHYRRLPPPPTPPTGCPPPPRRRRRRRPASPPTTGSHRWAAAALGHLL
jgi:hypothetical protein